MFKGQIGSTIDLDLPARALNWERPLGAPAGPQAARQTEATRDLHESLPRALGS